MSRTVFEVTPYFCASFPLKPLYRFPRCPARKIWMTDVSSRYMRLVGGAGIGGAVASVCGVGAAEAAAGMEKGGCCRGEVREATAWVGAACRCAPLEIAPPVGATTTGC